ncbi:MAG TPA: metallophosphoesterase [Planktothrix sp.]|jgi:calcineurin-like phosphoesterase family protein
MSIWFSSDHHFGHKNIIQYCARPFDDVEEMNEALVDAWNSCVRADDTVYYLGDFSLKQRTMEKYAPRLNGHKILIMGNHDSCHPVNRDGTVTSIGVYRKFFEEVLEELEWEDCLLHHMPYYDNDDDRYPEYRPMNHGKVLLHGHVHERWTVNDKQVNVGVDVWDYKPVSAVQIRTLIKRIEENNLPLKIAEQEAH